MGWCCRPTGGCSISDGGQDGAGQDPRLPPRPLPPMGLRLVGAAVAQGGALEAVFSEVVSVPLQMGADDEVVRPGRTGEDAGRLRETEEDPRLPPHPFRTGGGGVARTLIEAAVEVVADGSRIRGTDAAGAEASSWAGGGCTRGRA